MTIDMEYDACDQAEHADEAMEIAETKAFFREVMAEKQRTDSLNLARKRYHRAKSAKTGEAVICPSCAKEFDKRSYQQAFCSNKGKRNCKDLYWNMTDSKRAERANRFAS